MTKTKKYKIGELYQYNKFVPVIKITGKWLENYNFKIGDTINISIDNNTLIITKNK